MSGKWWSEESGGASLDGLSARAHLKKFPVTTDTMLSGGGPLITSPANTNINARICVIFPTAVAGVTCVSDNFAVYNTDDNLFAGAAFDVSYGLEIGSITYPLTFNGKRAITVERWGRVESDFLPVSIPANTKAFLRIRTFNLTAYSPAYIHMAPDYGDGIAADNASTDLTLGTGISGYGNPSASAVPGFSTIFGWAETEVPSLVALGDSTIRTGDTISAYSTLWNDRGHGFVARAGYGICGTGDCSRGGENVAPFLLKSNVNRLRYALDYSTAVVSYGRNDIDGANTASTVYANIAKMVERLKGMGFKKTVVCTLFPKTTSTDNWATVANQTRVNATKDDQLSGLIVANSAGADYVLDVRTAIADVSGVWIPLGTPDGVHPSKASHILVASLLRAKLGM